MTLHADKIIVANRGGMIAKYGTAGHKAVEAALNRLIKADAGRGIKTAVVNIDDAKEMSAVRGAPIAGSTDERGAKSAVDAINLAAAPDYILLLDGPDVIPHINLDPIAGLSDADRTIESDLPYACNAPYSRKANAFLAVTRVVGRLPMARSVKDADAFVRIIDACAAHRSSPAPQTATYFAISADVWRTSTQLTLNAVFGASVALKVSPKDAHAGIDPSLAEALHLVNCHGGRADWRWYGQKARSYPVAMESGRVAPHVKTGTVIAAECCYGAELYDPTLLKNPAPMCMTYLQGGAAAFVGSTCIAYGGAVKMSQADLICGYFLEEILKGASAGRAFLQARQHFVLRQTMSSPSNLKTLAQFVLYGDPSLVPITGAAEAATPEEATMSAGASAEDLSSARKLRRVHLRSDGLAIASSASFSVKRVQAASALRERIDELARQRGFETPPMLLTVSGGARFRQSAKDLNQEPQVAIAMKQDEHHDPQTGLRLPFFKLFTAHILGDGITAVEECESR